MTQQLRDIGFQIKRERFNKQITSLELSKIANISQATISNIENGKTKNFKSIIRIAEALGKKLMVSLV